MRIVRAFLAMGFPLSVSAYWSSRFRIGVAPSHSVVLDQQFQVLHRSELGRLENRRLGMGVLEDMLGR